MKSKTRNSITISSSDQVSFSIPLAGPMSRFLAWAIDVAVIVVALSILNSIVAMLGVLSADIARGFFIAFNFVLVLSYGIVLEWAWRGQTIGKRFMGLRVMDEQGLKLRIEQVVLRNLLRVIDRLPLLYMVGGLSALGTARNQRLGDIAAGTIVTYMQKTEIPDISDVLEHKYNSLRKHPHLEARLRKNTPPVAAALAVNAIARRDILDGDERIAVFNEMAEYFRGLVAFPDEDSMGISDEQYVRNVIDTLYNARAR
jgi:uncharacterized RDD family membrane protein YckC